MDTLGDQIKKARWNLGLTLAQLAAQTGIDQGLLSKYERNESIPVKNRDRLFSYLQLSSKTIINGASNEHA